MKILGVAYNLHDHNTYDGTLHYQEERYTRVKHNQDHKCILHNKFHTNIIKPAFESKDHVTAFSASKNGILRLDKDPYDDELKDFDDIYKFKPKMLWDHIYKDNKYYVDHHQSHAAYAFLSSGYEQSDILAIDGAAMSGKRCFFFDKDGNITDLSKEIPIGWAWNYIAMINKFGSLDAGKFMGLAASGKYSEWYYNIIDLIVSEIAEGRQEHLPRNRKTYKMEEYGVKDFAFTLQQYTLDKIKEHVYPLRSCPSICIAGGVAYNGYMNEEFTKVYDNVFVPPAVGDEGQSLGTYMHADYVLNGNTHIPNVYSGKEYEYEGAEEVNLTEVAQAIADGAIIGWYQGKSESGNRALGNRSILADPRNPNIKDIINNTIKMREDFRPFAPSVMEEHYQEYFDTNQPSPFMSRIVQVKSDKIPGVTHIDNTSRIQTVNKEQNEMFYNLINEFYKITGIPLLVNTSFNCQEPIVESPEDAIKTFNATKLDLLVINNYIIRK
jgi:carbamoyltransferase